MPSRPVRRQLDETDLLSAAGVVRRYLTGSNVEEDLADDVAQETVARLWENRWRLDRPTAPGYAIATARSLLAERRRQIDLSARHLHRLHEPITLPDAYESVELAQEHATLTSALQALPSRDRDLLIAHHVDEMSVADLARDQGSSPGAVAAALNRARGRLRLEYCLQGQRRGATDERCRQVLHSVALGNLGRQRALGAGRHLSTCQHCAPMATVITARDRHTAGLGPLVILVACWGLLRRLVTTHPAASAVGATTVAGSTAVVLVLSAAHHPAPIPQVKAAVDVAVTAPTPRTAVTTVPAAPRHGLLVQDRDLLPSAGPHDMSAEVGLQVHAVDVPVLAVDADEGFWVGTTAHRMWVQLLTAGESKQTVKAGDIVAFTGRIVSNRPGFAAGSGVSSAEAAGLLKAQHVHVEVPTSALQNTHR